MKKRMRGGVAPIEYSMDMGYMHDQPRSTNHMVADQTGGCGCEQMGGSKKMKKRMRGGVAPIDYSMDMGYMHDQPRSTNHKVGGRRKKI